MGKHICILQTSFARRDDTIIYLQSKIPDLRVDFITDSSLLTDIRETGSPSPEVYGRMALYAQAAEKMGADVILSTCSTAGDVADTIKKLVNVPLIRIDEPMARKAAALGDKIALITTLPTTVLPSSDIIRRFGREQGREISVTPFVVDGAWQALQSGDKAEHNSILIRQMKELDKMGFNAIVMAQVSMRELMPELSCIKTPVLCSFYSGLDYAVSMLENR